MPRRSGRNRKREQVADTPGGVTQPASEVPPAKPSRLGAIVTGSLVLLILLLGGYGLWTLQQQDSVKGSARPAEPGAAAAIEIPTIVTDGLDRAIVKAVETRSAAVRTNPKSGDAWGRLGMVFQVHGYNAEAILCYEEAERLAPSAMRWPYFLGMCVTLHDRDRAIAAYQRAAEKIDTGQASQLERRAVLLRVAETELEQGQDQAAEETLLLVCRDEANDPWANLLLARVKERRGDLTGARKHAQTAESEPTSRKAAGQILARVSQREGKTDEARARLASLLSLPDSSRPDPLANEVQQEGRGIHAAIEHANRQLLAGQYDNVIRLLTQAVVLYPDAPYAWVTLGKAELKVNRVAKAEDSFRKAIACDSRFVEAHFQLGLALGRQNRLEEATEAFRRAIELKPDLVPAQYMLGETLALRGRTNEAISALEICISGKPDLLAAYLRLAPLLEGNGQKPEAIRYLREAVRIHPESDAAKSMLARIESAP